LFAGGVVVWVWGDEGVFVVVVVGGVAAFLVFFPGLFFVMAGVPDEAVDTEFFEIF
jgi:hypothetical protein